MLALWQEKPGDYLEETAKQIERQFQLHLARLRINRDLLPGSIFKKESHPFDRRNICTIKHELVAKQLGIRFAIYRYEKLSQWIVTHAFIKTTAAWPEVEFERIMDIMSQVKQAMQ